MIGCDIEVKSTGRLDDPLEFARRHQRHLEIARDALLQSRAASADALSRHAVNPLFKIGDLVLLSTANMITSRRQRKLRHRWVGPFQVRNVFRNGVEIDLSESGLSSRLSKVWSNTHIKRYKTRAPMDHNTQVESGEEMNGDDVASVADFFEQEEITDVSSSESDSELSEGDIEATGRGLVLPGLRRRSHRRRRGDRSPSPHTPSSPHEHAGA